MATDDQIREFKEAQKIAEYVLPRLFTTLEEIFPELFRNIRKEDRLEFFRSHWTELVERTAKDIHWLAVSIKNQKREQYM